MDIPKRPFFCCCLFCFVLYFFKGNEGGADLGEEGRLGEGLGGMEGREIRITEWEKNKREKMGRNSLLKKKKGKAHNSPS